MTGYGSDVSFPIGSVICIAAFNFFQLSLIVNFEFGKFLNYTFLAVLCEDEMKVKILALV